MANLKKFERTIAAALVEAGCDTFSVADVRKYTRESRDDVLSDMAEHDVDLSAPFVNFLVISGVAIFTFFEDEFSVYVVPCEEFDLISKTNEFALSDVDAHRDLLARDYDRQSPDASLPRDVADKWLDESK